MTRQVGFNKMITSGGTALSMDPVTGRVSDATSSQRSFFHAAVVAGNKRSGTEEPTGINFPRHISAFLNFIAPLARGRRMFFTPCRRVDGRGLFRRSPGGKATRRSITGVNR